MIARLKQRLSDIDESLLNRMIRWCAGLLVVAAVGFTIYYFAGQDGEPDAGSLEHDIAGYEQAVRDNRNDLGARMGLAQLYYAAERYRDAATQYEAALSLDEASVVAMVGLGQALAAAGDDAGAIARFEQVIKLTESEDVPGDLVESAYYYLGSVLLEQNRPAEAITYLQHAVDVDRADADAWYLLGVANLEAGDLDEAIAALSQATEFVPDFAEAYEKLLVAYEDKGLAAESSYARGMVAYSRERFGEAQVELEAAVEASEELVVAYVGLGLLHEKQGEREEAASAYHVAVELEPDNYNARSGLSRVDEFVTEEAAP